MSHDLYAVLGVAPTADILDVRRAYRARALVCHPDKPTGDALRFHELSHAFSILGDPVTRSLHDLMRPTGSERVTKPIPPLARTHARTRSQALQVTLQELIVGGMREHVFDVDTKCMMCKGTGARDPHDFIVCLACNGGCGPDHHPCSSCGGEGGCNISTQQCGRCQGTRLVKTSTRYSVAIPPAVRDGQALLTVPSLPSAFVASVSHTFFDGEQHLLDPLGSPGHGLVCVSRDASLRPIVTLFLKIELSELMCGFQKTVTVFGEAVHFGRAHYDPLLGDPTAQVEQIALPFFDVKIFAVITFPDCKVIRPFAKVWKYMLLPKGMPLEPGPVFRPHADVQVRVHKDVLPPSVG